MIDAKKGLFYFTSNINIPHARLASSGSYYVPITPEVIPYLKNEPMTSAAKKEIEEIEHRILWLKQQRDSLEQRKPLSPDLYIFKPLAHQIDAISRMIETNIAGVWAQCGLGKTYISIHLVKEMKKRGKFRGVLVVCPKSLVRGVWLEEVKKFSDLSVYDLTKKKIIKGKTVYPQPPNGFDFYIINYEQLNKKKDVIKKLDINAVFFDESSKLKNHNTITWRAANDIVEKMEYRYLLSGSPMPHGPEDAWSQIYLLDRGMSLGTSYWYFMERTHKKFTTSDGRKHFWKPTASGAKWVKDQVSKISLYYDKRECIDLPAFQNIVIPCELSPKQRKAYDELKKELCTIVDGEYVVAKSATSVIPKFQQITGGFAKTVDDNVIPFPENPKLDTLLDLVESIDDKIIIWAWFRHEIEAIHKAILNLGRSCVYIYGGMNAKHIQDCIDGFKSGIEILVANQAVLGYGHNLVCAHYAIVFSNPLNYELRHQSRERIERIGQKEHMFYYDLVAKDTVDEKILKGLQSHESMQKYLIKAEV